MAGKDSAGTRELEEASFTASGSGIRQPVQGLLVTGEIYITNIETVAPSCVGLTVTGGAVTARLDAVGLQDSW